MGKFRARTKTGKNRQRWKKGQSSSSNPSKSRHRDAAKAKLLRFHMTVPVKQQRRSCSEEDYLLEPPNDFRNPMGSEANDDIDHFNSILTSLQGLADSISADFDQLDANDHLVDVNKIE